MTDRHDVYHTPKRREMYMSIHLGRDQNEWQAGGFARSNVRRVLRTLTSWTGDLSCG